MREGYCKNRLMGTRKIMGNGGLWKANDRKKLSRRKELMDKERKLSRLMGK